MNSRLCYIALVLLSFLAAQPSTAQVSTGTPPFGSFAGGPDIINLGNLNVSLGIPIRNKPGRGQNFVYSLQYDSSIYYPVTSSGVQSWQPVANWGWKGLTPAGLVYESYSATYSSGTCGQTGQNTWQSWAYGGLVYSDEHGTMHTFGGVSGSYVSSNGSPPYCPPSGASPSGVLTSAAGDGSGLTVSFYTDSNGFHPTLYSSSGKVINPPVVVNYAPPSGPTTTTDSNGNEITGNNGTFTDTLGQPALTILSSSSPYTTTLEYEASDGSYPQYLVSYRAYNIQTKFGCSVQEYSATGVNLVDKIELPDGTYYQFSYEPTPNGSGTYTGRVATIRFPSGGSISYTYTGSNDGIVCMNGDTAGFTRTTPDGTWSYVRGTSGSHFTTTVTAPSYGGVSDQTVITFLGDSSDPNNYEIERQIFAGSSSSGTLMETILHCYAVLQSNCSPTTGDTSGSVSLPISNISTTYQWPNSSGISSGTFDQYDTAGNLLSHAVYDYGASGSGTYSTSPLQTTTASFLASNGSPTNKPTEVKVLDSSGNTISDTQYGYDETSTVGTSNTPQHVAPPPGSRGNVTSVKQLVSGTTYLKTTYTNYDTGNVATVTDPNNIGVTTYTYGSAGCGNSFVTQNSTTVAGTGSSGATLKSGAAWNCVGGMPSSTTDLNGNSTNYTYGSDPYWRPQSIKDAAGNTTGYTYPTGSSPNTSTTSLSFYGGSSVNNTITTTDGLGRTIFQQKQQAPNYGFYDSVAIAYDSRGRTSSQTLPFTAEAGSYPTPPFSQPSVNTTYDALGRTIQVQDGGGGTVTYSYNYNSVPNDVLVSAGPAPSGENSKRRVLQYNGAGQLALVCEVTGLSEYGACANTGANGFLTKYTYDGPNLITVQQNAQPNSQGGQTRSVQYDNLGRKTQETIPEWSAGTGSPGTSHYTYDSDGSGACSGSSAGDLIKSVDNAGNVICYTYDSLHRILSSKVVSGTYSAPSVTPQAFFVYDAATFNGTSMQNMMGNIAEAYTLGCTGTGCTPTLQTDEFFSASLVTSGSAAGGVLSQIWEKTPNSGGYFLTQDTLYPNGALATRTSTVGSTSYGYPNMSYGLDGEGRPYWASDGTRCINPVTATTYNASNSATSVTFGNASTGAGADVDSFQYDPNTNRPTGINYFVNASTNPFNVGMRMNWNANGSLQQMAYSDDNDSTKNQNCTYVADDLSRIASVNCGSNTWAQTFTYDPLGNITKSGSISYQAGYTRATNQVSAGSISPAPQYDANGNQLTSTPANLSWNAWNVPISVNSITATYDAIGRMVEKVSGGTATQFVYSPLGTNIASVSLGVLTKGTVPLPGGDTAIYAGTGGMPYLRHTDWLGSSRLATTWSHGVQSKVAYGPFGETYNESGTPDRSFTGQDQDVVTGSGGTGVYDYLFRKYDPSAGRWLSPDPLGWGAMSQNDPQSLNRYAYVTNRPMNSTDPLGLDCLTVSSDGDLYGNSGDCLGIDPNNEYYVDCDGCLAGATGSIDANGNLMIGEANGTYYLMFNVGYTASEGSSADFNDSFDALPDMGPNGSPGAPGAPNNSTPWYKTCTAQALGKGLGTAALDGIGILPEGGTISAAFSLFHGAAGVSNGTKILGRVAFGAGLISTASAASDLSEADGVNPSSVINGLQVTAGGFGVAKGLIEDIPVAGQAIAVGATVLDLIGTGVEVWKCNR